MEPNTNQAQINELEAELERHLTQLSSSAEQTLEQRSHILSSSMRESIELHSEQIRNLGLISGVVAPFSLTLLQIQSISVSVPTLLFGFLLLLVNIILSQFLLGRELNNKNRLMVSAILEHASAFTNKLTLVNTNSPSYERTTSVSDFIKNINEFDKLLGISPYSTEPLEVHTRLRTYTRWTVALFSFGCGLIVLSIFLNPLLDLLVQLLW